ncbi:MAG: plastocyanin/azurin family copper-binding protein [Actinomycetota bacterium]
MNALRRALLSGLMLITLAPACTRAAAAPPGIRTVPITIHYSRFSRDTLVVAPGETVRFVVRNTDPIDHEFILGNQHVQNVHEAGTEPYHPPRPGETTVPAGTTQTTTYTFPDVATPLTFACHLPGHFAYGMHGDVRIES